MKKKILLFTAVLAVILLCGTAAAALSSGKRYTDENNDGVCDNRIGYSQFKDQDGYGICDYWSGGRGMHGRHCYGRNK